MAITSRPLTLALVALMLLASTRQGIAQELQGLNGLWSGSWGGGQRNGVVFQPVIAEMLILEDRVEAHGLPSAGKLAGTVRFDGNAKQMTITLKATDGKEAMGVVFTYEHKGDDLTLTDADKRIIHFRKRPATQTPQANASAEIKLAHGITDTGDLLVTEYAELRVGDAGTTLFEPRQRKLKATGATVLLVEEGNCKKLTLEEARARLCKAMPVVVSYRPDDQQPRQQFHELWREVGDPTPDGENVWRTYAQLLRPGTLIFVLSARANVPQP